MSPICLYVLLPSITPKAFFEIIYLINVLLICAIRSCNSFFVSDEMLTASYSEHRIHFIVTALVFSFALFKQETYLAESSYLVSVN